MSSRVVVRIIRQGKKYLVKGRSTSVVCDTFDEAWIVSIPYFVGRKR